MGTPYETEKIDIDLSHFWAYIQWKWNKHIKRYLHPDLFIMVLFTIARIQSQCKCPYIDIYIKEM